jgi:integrase/recombinase XerD
VAAAAAEDEKAFLSQKLDSYRKRHKREPSDLSGWRWGHTSGIHMVMRLAQGQWPPVTTPTGPQDAFRRNLCITKSLFLCATR